MVYTHGMRSIVLGFDSLLDCLDEILTVPAVSELRLGGVNGNKTIASYEDVKEGRFGFKMAAKIDYDDSKTDIRALLRHIFHIAKENVVYLYYADLLDAIEAKAEAEESGMADKLKVYKCCYFLPLRKSA